MDFHKHKRRSKAKFKDQNTSRQDFFHVYRVSMMMTMTFGRSDGLIVGYVYEFSFIDCHITISLVDALGLLFGLAF